jgi:hypothetical protein
MPGSKPERSFVFIPSFHKYVYVADPPLGVFVIVPFALPHEALTLVNTVVNAGVLVMITESTLTQPLLSVTETKNFPALNPPTLCEVLFVGPKVTPLLQA